MASDCLAYNKIEAEQITINPDNRGIDYSPYEKEKDNQLYFNRYIKKNGGAWCSDDYEMKVYKKNLSKIREEKKKNELLLNSVYEVNPDAFNQLARIYRKIFKDEASRLQLEQKEWSKILSGNKSNVEKSNENQYDKNHPHLYFPGRTINCLSQDKKGLALEFNAIEDEIYKVYQKIPRSQFHLYFDLAFQKARIETQKIDTDAALKNMALNIRTIQMGSDSSDEVITKLGVPTSRICQDGIEIIKYKYDLIINQDNQSIMFASVFGQTMQVGKSVIAEIQCDANGKVIFISVTKTDPQAGSVDEIYKVGQRNNSTSLNSL
jgi:hypothetical protein